MHYKAPLVQPQIPDEFMDIVLAAEIINRGVGVTCRGGRGLYGPR